MRMQELFSLLFRLKPIKRIELQYKALSTNREINATKATVANAAAISSRITAVANNNADFSLQAKTLNKRFVPAIIIPAKNIAFKTPDRITKRPPNNVKITVVIQPKF